MEETDAEERINYEGRGEKKVTSRGKADSICYREH